MSFTTSKKYIVSIYTNIDEESNIPFYASSENKVTYSADFLKAMQTDQFMIQPAWYADMRDFNPTLLTCLSLHMNTKKS